MSEQHSLVDEFNTTAAKYMKQSGNVSLDVILLKYATLMRYKLYEEPCKKEVTETLYRCATDSIRAYSDKEASLGIYIYDSVIPSIKRLFDAMLEEGQTANIPAAAPQELSSLALALLRRVEEANPDNFMNYEKRVQHERLTEYREKATQLSAFALGSADRLREAINEVTSNVTTSQPLTTRPIQLKQNTGAPSA